MRIPEVRTELTRIANELAQKGEQDYADRILELVAEMWRRRGVPKTPPKNRTFDRRTAQEIRAYKANHPHLSHQEVATALNVNPGRVSEALIGKRR